MKLPEITPKNTIRTFALVCVAVTSGFIMYMIVWLIGLLSEPSWCDRVIDAANRPESAFGGCFQLLQQQMAALAVNSYIFGGVISLCLASLMVIVVAGGKISFTGSKDGVSGNISGATDTPTPTPPVVTTTTTTAVTPPAAPDATLEDTP